MVRGGHSSPMGFEGLRRFWSAGRTGWSFPEKTMLMVNGEENWLHSIMGQ